jgi:Mn-containing catalase
MPQLREMLVDELQGLLHAETQLTDALPKMANAANSPMLKQAFEKHLAQTQTHVERLQQGLGMLGERVQTKPCKAMMGLVSEGEEKIQEARGKDPLAADLSLIAAAQKVEHYEISGYGTAKTLARQIGELELAKLLSLTVGEEESTDFLLTNLAKPLLQQAALDEMGGDVNLETVPAEPRSRSSKAR